MDQRLLAKTALILLASLSATADEFHWNITSGDGDWNSATSWVDADGNTATSYPGQNSTTDIAVFHGMGMCGRAMLTVDINVACVRFEDGNSTFAHESEKSFHAGRFEISPHATFGYMVRDWNGFTTPSDFTIGNREDLLVDGGLIRGGMNYQNWAGGNWGSRKALSIDENGHFLTGQGAREMRLDLWGDTTYDSPYGLRYGEWQQANETFRGVNFNNAGTWTLTLPSAHIAPLNEFSGVGKMSDKGQGTVATGTEPLYFWPRFEVSTIQTNFFRAKIDAPTFLQCGSGCTVLFDDHSTETCAYDIIAGTLKLGGEIKDFNSDTAPVEIWNCPLGTGPIHIRWDGMLHVASANALNPASDLHIHSFRERGLDKNATDILYGKVRMDADGTVHYFTLDGKPMLNGTYGSSASSAQYQRDDIFSGTGVLTVRACTIGHTVILAK